MAYEKCESTGFKEIVKANCSVKDSIVCYVIGLACFCCWLLLLTSILIK